MGHRPFKKPLYLKFHPTGNYQARSAWEALEYLELYWNAPRDMHYRRAQKLCRNAIDGWTTAEKAREAVATAAQRAGLLVTDRRSAAGAGNVVYRTVPKLPVDAGAFGRSLA